MSLAEIRDSAIEGARQLKEAACRNRPKDIRAVIDVYRGADLIASVIPDHHDRDLILKVFRGCALGYDADGLSVVFESYTATVEIDEDDLTPERAEELAKRSINPVTGREWEQGDMADAVANHGAIEKGWLYESLTVLAANRAGDISMAQLPYRYVGGRHLSWLRESVAPATAVPGGLMTDYMIAAMNEPSLSTMVPYELTAEGRAERDVTATNALMRSFPCRVALFALHSDVGRVRVLRRDGIAFS